MIVLDTHAWLWWVAAPERLPDSARRLIAGTAQVGVSAVSAWEVGMLAQRGRITLDRPTEHWITAALTAEARIVELALSARIAVRAAALTAEGFHGDPADRFIYATARAHDAVLVTRDAALREFDPDRTAW